MSEKMFCVLGVAYQDAPKDEKWFFQHGPMVKIVGPGRFGEESKPYSYLVLPQFTVADLIEALKKYPQNARVGYADYEMGDWLPIDEPRFFEYNKETNELRIA